VNEDRASRYHRLKRRAAAASLAWSVALLGGMMVTGLSVSLRHGATALAWRLAGARWHLPVTLLAYVLLLSLIHEAGSLPLGFYSAFALERRYGLSNETLGAWLVDRGKAFGIALVLAWGGIGTVYALIRVSPERWWLGAGVIFALVIIGLTNIVPIVLLPLFYTVKPLGRESLCARLMTLADRAGAPIVGAYEWGLGERTRKANAALTGLGRTRRILISDTMLAGYSDDEIEVVLAHELAHHVHHDIWKGIAFESGLVLLGFFLAARALAALTATFGLEGSSDVAGLPLLLLVCGAVSLVMVPVAHAMSRAYERSADRFALRLTANPAAFVSAMRRLGAQNLAEERPSKLVEWLFHSHPPLAERIAAAERPKAR
jgi:STE24 endopeptidase